MPVQVDVTKESVAVFVDLSDDESLTYRVTVRGPQPNFTLLDQPANRLLMSNESNPVTTMPSVVFERKWPLAGDPTQATRHVLGMQFLDLPPPAPATSYRYVVEKNKSDDTTELVMDITYTSADRESFFQRLQVNTFGG